MIRPVRVSGKIRNDELDAFLAMNTVGMQYASVSVAYREGSWPSSLVLVVETTMNGRDWDTAAYIDPETGTTTAVGTITANSRKRLILVSDATAIRVRVSVVKSAGATVDIDVEIYGEAQDASPLSLAQGAGSSGGIIGA